LDRVAQEGTITTGNGIEIKRNGIAVTFTAPITSSGSSVISNESTLDVALNSLDNSTISLNISQSLPGENAAVWSSLQPPSYIPGGNVEVDAVIPAAPVPVNTQAGNNS